MTDLTAQEEVFARYYSNNGNEVEAARRAGYADPMKDGVRLLMTPIVSRRIREMAFCDLNARLGDIMRAFVRIATDNIVPMRERVMVFRTLVRLKDDARPIGAKQARAMLEAKDRAADPRKAAIAKIHSVADKLHAARDAALAQT